MTETRREEITEEGRERPEEKQISAEREERILQMVRERMPDIEVSPVEVCKNNGLRRRGIRFFAQGNPKGVLVYWDGVAAACGESCTEEEAADYICREAEENIPVAIQQELVRDWENAKHLVYKKVVNYERNADRLHDMVHRRYLDLAEVCCLQIPLGEAGWGSVEISARMPEIWGISEEELSEQADACMDMEEYQIQSIKEFLEADFSEERDPFSDLPDPGLYLIRNRRRGYGAGVITRKELMKGFMEQIGEDCYILPSSVHELIALPVSEKSDRAELELLVQEVNQAAVSAEEYLSDHVYLCHRDTGEVELCCSE